MAVDFFEGRDVAGVVALLVVFLFVNQLVECLFRLVMVRSLIRSWRS